MYASLLSFQNYFGEVKELAKIAMIIDCEFLKKNRISDYRGFYPSSQKHMQIKQLEVSFYFLFFFFWSFLLF